MMEYDKAVRTDYLQLHTKLCIHFTLTEQRRSDAYWYDSISVKYKKRQTIFSEVRNSS